MAYTDPKNIREHVIKLRFNDYEAKLINAWVEYSGQQKATFLREILLEQAALDIGIQDASKGQKNEVPATVPQSA